MRQEPWLAYSCFFLFKEQIVEIMMNSNLKRKNEIKVRFTDEEYLQLNKMVEDSGLSREAFVRKRIVGIIPLGKPSEEYLEVIRQLRKIGNNINQLAVVANKSNSIDTMLFKEEVRKLTKEITEIKTIASRPIVLIGGKEFGNNEDLGNKG